MDRRLFTVTLALGILRIPPGTHAQQQESVQRIGFLLTTSSAPQSSPCLHVFRQGLRELGWIEGRNMVIEVRTAEDIVERLPALAGELARLNVKVIVAGSNVEVEAAKSARGGLIPVVSLSMYDPVGSGFIGSYAKPGGNVTGLTSDVTPEQAAKRLQLLREAAPKIGRVGVLWSRAVRPTGTMSREVRLGADRLGLTLYPVEVRSPGDLDIAFTNMRRDAVDAVSVLSGGILFMHRARVIELAMRYGWPVLSYDASYPMAGGLMSYGVSYGYLCRRSADYVDKILRGAKPGDLPVEQPMTFHLVINLRTAKALGLTIPPSLLLRADQVIE